MSEKYILKWVSYFLFIVVITSSLFQLYYTHQIRQKRQSIQEVQRLLNLTDQLNANLGSVQQAFRSYAIGRDLPALGNLSKFRNIVIKILGEKLSLSAAYPDLNILVRKMDSVYKAENKSINSYISADPKFNGTDQSINTVERSESGMGMVWTLMFDYRVLLENRVKLLNQGINEVSTNSYISNIISLVVLSALLFVTGYHFFRKRRAQIIASNSPAMSEHDMLLRALLENTTTCMLIRDLEGKILFANRATQHFVGIEEEQILGKSFDQLEFKKNIEYGNTAIRTDVDYPYSEIEERVIVDGDTQNFFTRKFPIRSKSGEVIASGLISRNITERIVYEEGLKKSRNDAQNARLTQEQFMANISHEIRTPMNGIMGMTELLAETTLDSTQYEYLEIIRQSSKNLMILINDILDFSKIEAGKLELEKISFKIIDVLAQVVDSMQVKAKEKQLPIILNIDHKVPLGVMGDPLRLHQIISNILSNAIKFTSEGSVTIDVSAYSRNSSIVKVQFRITDTGIGMPEERIGYIFQSFTQTSLDITRKFGGTGLGLAIVKQLVTLYGGEISVSSQVGKGSSFLIEIPFNTVPVANRTAEEDAKFALLCGKHVLVVEDNIINQKVIIKTLENSGLQTTLADNGYSAIELLKHQQFDLIIMDIQMPEIDGRETTVKIRQELGLAIPIIAMTASVLADEADKCKAAGMNEYISKPFIKEDLFEKMLLFI